MTERFFEASPNRQRRSEPMPDLIPPHGGLAEPVDRTVPNVDAAGLPRIPVSNADLSSLYRIGDGGLSPLTGPMERQEWDRVLDEEVVVRGGKKYAWTIPIALPVSAELAGTLKPGQQAALVNEAGSVVGTIALADLYPWDKLKYNRVVYQTERTDHPGARIALGDPRTHLVGGEVHVLPQPKHPEYGDLVLTPRQTRALFRAKSFERVVAFQTRNPLHRAHEYALVAGLERLTRDGHFAAAVLNPLVGETKVDDLDAAPLMKADVELRVLPLEPCKSSRPDSYH